ncbi:uncharacterized protein LOC111350333 isoform X2 [Spodoptera litura]|uniref:Uncharacterized protein LOC111350333 isoform X2 n=1 Tax=Spodoptera litura TaxID=69820 RepID=A0A9J7DUQ3_SPOLT|nr:uncharacterized protein LOC111350333 isoform X2 [Spodoptera litura]
MVLSPEPAETSCAGCCASDGMVSHRRARRPWLWLAAAAVALVPLLATAIAADVIFRVPEVRHAAASKPVGTGRGNGSRGNESERWAGAGADDALLEVRYEEYFVEHDVSTAAARRAAADLNVEDIPPTRPGCGPCSEREHSYCETRVLADHCCCERRFVREPFPWLPHTCYVGARRCRPLAHDCAQYARLRDCCCHRRLAERWKSILSESSRAGVSGLCLLVVGALLVVARL